MAQNGIGSAVERLIKSGVDVNVENVVGYFVYCVHVFHHIRSHFNIGRMAGLHYMLVLLMVMSQCWSI